MQISYKTRSRRLLTFAFLKKILPSMCSECHADFSDELKQNYLPFDLEKVLYIDAMMEFLKNIKHNKKT